MIGIRKGRSVQEHFSVIQGKGRRKHTDRLSHGGFTPIGDSKPSKHKATCSDGDDNQEDLAIQNLNYDQLMKDLTSRTECVGPKTTNNSTESDDEKGSDSCPSEDNIDTTQLQTMLNTVKRNMNGKYKIRNRAKCAASMDPSLEKSSFSISKDQKGKNSFKVLDSIKYYEHKASPLNMNM